MIALFGFEPLAHAGQTSAPATTYTLEKGMSLSQVGILFYGDPKYGAKIARWNNIKNPKDIDPGTVLRLYEKPKVSRGKGQRLLLEYWRGKMKEWDDRHGDIPKALGGGASPSPGPSPAPSNRSETPQPELSAEELERRQQATAMAEAQRLAKIEADRRAQEALAKKKADDARLAAERARIAAEKARIAAETDQRKREAELKRLAEAEAARKKEEARIKAENAARAAAEALRLAEIQKVMLARIEAEKAAKTPEVMADDEETEAAKSNKTAVPGGMTAEQALDAAKTAMTAKKYREAADFASQSRKANPENVGAWLIEVRALKLAGDEAQAKKIALDLFDARPETRGLPFLKFAITETE